MADVIEFKRRTQREKHDQVTEQQREQPGMPNSMKWMAALHQQRPGGAAGAVIIDKPTPERITAALDLANLYGPEVDRACGVEEPTVDLWETGELVPTREQIGSLAMLTGFPWRFFYLPPPLPVEGLRICEGSPARDLEVNDPFENSDQPTLF